MKTFITMILAVSIGAYGVSAAARIIRGAEIVRPTQSQAADRQEEAQNAKAVVTPVIVPAIPTVPDNGDATQTCIEFQDKQCWDNLRVHIQ